MSSFDCTGQLGAVFLVAPDSEQTMISEDTIMETIRRSYRLPLLFFVVLFTLPIAALANDGAAPHGNMVMHLGKVTVRGEQNIVQTLQAIKVGLQQPYSSNPKLANVVVCRLVDQLGSHIHKWLICGTNRVLGERRTAVSVAMDLAVSAGGSTGSSNCVSEACYTQVFSVLNATLSSQPGNYLHTSVNAAGFRTLLEKIPYPTSEPNAGVARKH